jgi:thioredoxin reductase
MLRTDVTVIGAGPAGLFAAFYVGMRDLTVRIIDPLPEPGGQLMALYPEKYIYDVAGFPKILAKDLVSNLVEQLEPFKPIYNLGERAEKLEELNGDFHITTSSGHTYVTGAVIIAAGVGAFEPRKVGCPGEAEFTGKGVYYAVKSKAEFAGKRVLIVGGGDSAADWTLGLKDIAEVTLIHRREQFRAHAATVNQMIEAAEAGEVKILTPYELKEIRGDGRVREAVIFNNTTKEETVLGVDAVIILAGYLSKLGPLATWGLEMEGNKKIKVLDATMRTSRPGIFACGDVASYNGKLPLICLGFGEASIAANYAAAHAHPELKVNPGHSSERDEVPTPAATH